MERDSVVRQFASRPVWEGSRKYLTLFEGGNEGPVLLLIPDNDLVDLLQFILWNEVKPPHFILTRMIRATDLLFCDELSHSIFQDRDDFE